MENEPKVKNMGLIPESNLEKRALLFETKKTFQNIKKFIKDIFGKKVVFSEHQGLQFGIEFVNTKAEVHLLDDPANLVSLSYATLTSEDGHISFEQAYFQVVVQENNQTVIKKVKYNTDNKKIEIYDSEAIDGTLAAAWSVIDERNKKGILEDLAISPQAFGDFCLPGGYQYCGQKCGSCGSCTAGGGGPLKNAVDGCCYIHDKCYAKYSSNRCANCDWALVDCVNNNRSQDPIAADAVALFFMLKCGWVI
jgi:hypothetical protein